MGRRVLAGGITFVLCALAAAAPAGAAKRTSSGVVPRIEVISNRADVISGGDALVAISFQPRTAARAPRRHHRRAHRRRAPAFTAQAAPRGIRVLLGNRNVTSAFAMRPDGRYEALVSGLANGSSVLTARLADGTKSSVTIVNHPIGGPVFSGPQLQPWQCTNGSADPQCNTPTTYTYEYKSSVDGGMHTYDPASPPSDVATTRTQTGTTVPFIVRVETGYQDRDQYQIALLYQPGKAWAPWAPQPQFNHKLLITHGASCGIDHQSATAPSTTSDTAGAPGATAGNSPITALGLGFAVMSTALDNAGHDCSVVTEAESLIMAKEHLIEEYGTLRYTIGTGCSGGSLAQQQIANAYPGVYQGILPQCSFPDAWSTGQQLAAYHLDRLYFENPTKWGLGIVWTPDQIAAVEGHPNHANAVIFDNVYWTSLADPTSACPGVQSSQDYNAQTNPSGVRCTLADYMVNVFGPRPQSVWTDAERHVGHGFAGLPISDVGVQFGLDALRNGQITPAQFVDLNAKIGGADIDLNPTAGRSDATEPALTNVYRSGAINETNNLTSVAIIDLRGPDPGAFHDAYRSFTIRARLQNQEGHFPRNDVIWFGQTPLIGDPSYTTQGLLAMDRWLSAVASDHRAAPLAQKVADDRPGDVHDRCSAIDGVEQVSLPGAGPVCEMQAVQTRFATPAMVAGESVATDINKCQLGPLRRQDYYPIQFSADQWAALQQAFPSGVCDWAKRGVDQQNTIAWQTYQDARGGVVYGGRPLGPAPPGSGGGWADPAFSSWLSPPGGAGKATPKAHKHKKARKQKRSRRA